MVDLYLRPPLSANNDETRSGWTKAGIVGLLLPRTVSWYGLTRSFLAGHVTHPPSNRAK